MSETSSPPNVPLSEASSQDPAASISDSSKPECQSLGNASKTPSAEKSSQDIGPTSPATRTLEVSAFTQNQRDEIRELEVAGALAAEPGAKQQTYLAFHATQDPISSEGFAPSLGANAHLAVLMSSAEDSPAKTFPSPESGLDSAENEADCSSRQYESLTLFSGTEDGSSLKTFPDSFPQTTDEISELFSRRWPKSGFTTSPGECWTADTSECPSGGGEFSSLPDVLEDQVPERFYLSQKAAAGILRRSEKRGRDLPKHLHQALSALSRGAESGATE